MSKFVLTGARIFSGGADLTGNSNKVELATDVEEKETTNFGSSGWKEFLGGLRSTKIMGAGQWEAGDTSKVDDDLWAALGGRGAWTTCPSSADVGSLSWFTYALRGSYTFGGQVGDVAPWEANLTGTWPLVRGVSLHPPGTARTATGNGTAVEHVAVSSSQYLYAALHVLSVSGTDTPTLTVKVQSDDGAGFASATDRITFTAATARTGEVLRTAGPITDTFFRVSWTISGTNPSFLFVCSVGVA